MSARTETMLWIVQRISAGVLAVCVLVHLVSIVYVTRAGLSGADIVARLQDSVAWLGFYLLFLVSVSIHAPIGIRTVLVEHTELPKGLINILVLTLLGSLLWLGAGSMFLLFKGPR